MFFDILDFRNLPKSPIQLKISRAYQNMEVLSVTYATLFLFQMWVLNLRSFST